MRFGGLTKMHYLDLIIRARVLVGYLGENGQYAWWDTSFISPTGLRFLAIDFPRSTACAAITSVSHAAMLTHSRHIGKVRAFHLFRLPVGVEQALHERLRVLDEPFLAGLIGSREQALAMLESCSDGGRSEDGGPIRVGSIETIAAPGTLKAICRHYRAAFAGQRMSFPYLSSA